MPNNGVAWIPCCYARWLEPMIPPVTQFPKGAADFQVANDDGYPKSKSQASQARAQGRYHPQEPGRSILNVLGITGVEEDADTGPFPVGLIAPGR
jgi:hypothetical protein